MAIVMMPFVGLPARLRTVAEGHRHTRSGGARPNPASYHFNWPSERQDTCSVRPGAERIWWSMIGGQRTPSYCQMAMGLTR
jgi:hypothetical protein